MKQNETKFQKKLRRRLEAEVGGFWWKVHGSIFQMTGLPDICGCVCGLYVGIETKVGRNKLSDIQQTRIKQIREAGGLAFGVWEDELEYAIRRVKLWIKKYALQLPEESRKIIFKEKTARTVYGARDWEDAYSNRTRSVKTKKRTHSRHLPKEHHRELGRPTRRASERVRVH